MRHGKPHVAPIGCVRARRRQWGASPQGAAREFVWVCRVAALGPTPLAKLMSLAQCAETNLGRRVLLVSILKHSQC